MFQVNFCFVWSSPGRTLMSWCEANGVHFLLGLAKNRRLLMRISLTMKKTRRDWASSGRAARRFIQISYRTRSSWSRGRRVLAKAEHMDKGENSRFVVTNLSSKRYEARVLYEKLYCARGEWRTVLNSINCTCSLQDQFSHRGGQPTAPVVLLPGLRDSQRASRCRTSRNTSRPGNVREHSAECY